MANANIYASQVNVCDNYVILNASETGVLLTSQTSSERQDISLF